MTDFFIPKVEVRSKLSDGVKKYIIKGYATTADNIYSYKKGKDMSFKEFFTKKAIENITRKAKSEKIWVDYGHQVGFNVNLQKALEDVETRSGLDLSNEKKYLNEAIKISDIPMFKLEDLKIDDKGLFVEIHANPFYRDMDSEHRKYFDTVWNSLENGFINGLSLNMKPTEFIDIDSNLRQIDNAEVFGISLLSGAANDQANITEVAMRCCMRGETECQTRNQATSLMM